MTLPVIIPFDESLFRSSFPAYANVTSFPSGTLNLYWTWSTYYLSNISNYGALRGTSRQLALNMMTAHLVAQNVIIGDGNTPYIVQGSTIDKISVTLEPPPIPNQWQWWLNTTPYGQQLLALLQANTAGGWSIGGTPQTSSFRNAGGGFGRFGGCGRW